MEQVLNNTNASRPLIRRSLGLLSNKYLLAGSFFLVWMFFFDPKDLAATFKRQAKFRELQKSDQHLSQIIEECETELSQLKTDAQTIEKYAREKYLMKKDNEDLYILPTADANK